MVGFWIGSHHGEVAPAALEHEQAVAGQDGRRQLAIDLFAPAGSTILEGNAKVPASAHEVEQSVVSDRTGRMALGFQGDRPALLGILFLGKVVGEDALLLVHFVWRENYIIIE